MKGRGRASFICRVLFGARVAEARPVTWDLSLPGRAPHGLQNVRMIDELPIEIQNMFVLSDQVS